MSSTADPKHDRTAQHWADLIDLMADDPDGFDPLDLYHDDGDGDRLPTLTHRGHGGGCARTRGHIPPQRKVVEIFFAASEIQPL